MEKEIHVICPCCKKRLFDMDPEAEGVITIKCGRCRAVVAVKMMRKDYSCAAADASKN